jgi:hypothetical protein
MSVYSAGVARLLARWCRARSAAAHAAYERHRQAALTEKMQKDRDLRLAFAEVASCAARRFKQWETTYTMAAEDYES